MSQGRSSDERRTNYENMLKTIAIICAIISATTGFVALALPFFLNPEPKTIDSHFSKCETTDAVIYMGVLSNTEAGHAKDLELSGALNAEIIDFTINLNSEVKKEYNKPNGAVRLNIQRLTSGSKCTFNIVTAKNSDIKKAFTVSWGDKGTVILKLQACDEKIQWGIDIGSHLSKLSRNARQTVVERNDN